MKIVSRQEALKRGLKKYFTGVPCKNGHISERVITGSCIQCRADWGKTKKAREYQKEYMEEYKHTKQYKKAAQKATADHRSRRRYFLFEQKKQMSCVYCGESNPLCLDMDHIDRDTKEGAVGIMVTNGTKWSDVLSELEKCQPVCRNCHNIKSIIESGKLKDQDIEQYVPDSMKHLMEYD